MIFTERDGELAFQYHTKIQENELKRRELLAENAKLLSKMKGGLYKSILGDEKAEWSGYLGQIEVMYSRNDVYNMIRIYDKFCKDLGVNYKEIADIPKSRLLELIPVISSLGQLQEWIDKARVLSNSDFRDEVRVAKGLVSMDSCQHKFKEYEICSQCGLKCQRQCQKD
jgi:hypothetical protein